MKKTVRSLRKWFAVLMIGILLVASLSSCASQEKVLKIGYVTEQTGVEAYIGQASTPALQDHIDKINAEGGIGGYKLQLVVYDTRSEVTDAVAVSKRLMDQDKAIAIIGPSWSAAGILPEEIQSNPDVIKAYLGDRKNGH